MFLYVTYFSSTSIEIIIIIFAFNQMFMEWGCICVEVFFNSDVEGSDCDSYIKIMVF